jgi:hypothetical protein
MCALNAKRGQSSESLRAAWWRWSRPRSSEPAARTQNPTAHEAALIAYAMSLREQLPPVKSRAHAPGPAAATDTPHGIAGLPVAFTAAFFTGHPAEARIGESESADLGRVAPEPVEL